MSSYLPKNLCHHSMAWYHVNLCFLSASPTPFVLRGSIFQIEVYAAVISVTTIVHVDTVLGMGFNVVCVHVDTLLGLGLMLSVSMWSPCSVWVLMLSVVHVDTLLGMGFNVVCGSCGHLARYGF